METTQNEHLDCNFPQQFYNQLELLFTRPNIQIPDQYIRKQDGVQYSNGIQILDHLASDLFSTI